MEASTSREKRATSEDEAPKKKPRLALSCSACRRRKVKCDRSIPCSSCVERGVANSCKPEEERRETEGRDVLRRLAGIEDTLQRLVKTMSRHKRGPELDSDSEAEQEEPFNDPSDNARYQEASRALQDLESSTAHVVPPPIREGRTPPGWPAFEPAEGAVSIYVTTMEPPQNGPVAQKIYDLRLQAIFDSIPSQEVVKYLIDEFHKCISFHFHVIDTSSLASELMEFEVAQHLGHLKTIHLAWIARFLAILSASADSLSEDDAPAMGMSPAEVRANVLRWHESSMEALELCHWLRTPQVWVIQTLLLYEPVHQAYPSQSGSVYSSWMPLLAIAVRLALQLDFDRLGSPGTRLPTEDPALPKNADHAREICKRIWWCLVFSDTIKDYFGQLKGGEATRATTLVPPRHNTPAPLNCDDRDLPRIGQLDRTQLNQHSQTTQLLIRIDAVKRARRSERQAETYDAVMGIQSSLHRCYQGLGAFGILGDDKNSAQVSLAVLYNKIMTAHRPYMIRSFTESEFEPSLYKCVSAARQGIAAHAAMGSAPIGRMTYLISFTFSSCVVLATALVYSARGAWRPDDQAALRSSVDDACKILTRGLIANNFRIRQMCQHGLSLIKTLLGLSVPGAQMQGSMADVLNSAGAVVRSKLRARDAGEELSPSTALDFKPVAPNPVVWSSLPATQPGLQQQVIAFDWDLFLSEFPAGDDVHDGIAF